MARGSRTGGRFGSHGDVRHDGAQRRRASIRGGHRRAVAYLELLLYSVSERGSLRSLPFFLSSHVSPAYAVQRE